MELKGLLLVTLFSLASATPVDPAVSPFAPSKVAPRKNKLPFPSTFYDLPTGDPRTGPLPTGKLGSPLPPWRHENGVGVYKDPNQIAPLWYTESEKQLKKMADTGGHKDVVPAPSKTTKKNVLRSEVAIPTPTVLGGDCYVAARIMCGVVLGLTDCEQQCAKYATLQPVGKTRDCIPLQQTGFDDPLGIVSASLLSEGEMSACWSECRNRGHGACELCAQKLRLGGLTPSTQPARYDPWGWGPKQSRGSVDTAAETMAFQMLWKCAVNCMRDGAKPCTACNGLWDESKKMVSTRGSKEELEFWVCVRECSRDRLMSCMECETAWRQQLATASPKDLPVEQAAAYAEIWNCVVHCDKDRTQKMCAPCDELWRKWDAGLPPFGPERAGLITAGVDDGSPSDPNTEEFAIRSRLDSCMKGCTTANEIKPTSYCNYCEVLVRSVPLLVPHPWIRRSISPESSKTIAKRLLFVWDPATGVFKCTEQCAKGKDYYISCLPCLYDKGIPVGDNLPETGQAEVGRLSLP